MPALPEQPLLEPLGFLAEGPPEVEGASSYGLVIRR